MTAQGGNSHVAMAASVAWARLRLTATIAYMRTDTNMASMMGTVVRARLSEPVSHMTPAIGIDSIVPP